MKRTPQAQYERDFTALKHYLIGRDYTEALRALGIAVRWHVGFRKDKVTPQLHHQVWVCFNFLNAPIKGLTPLMEERALSALLCHDTVEDHPVTLEDLRKAGLRPLTVDFVKGLTKVPGETDDEFFQRLLAHWMLPILKACDRDNNVMTMQGAFAIPKMKAYIEETRKYILVLLKKASNLYPEHHRAYSALATGIKKQLRIYEGFIAAAEATETKIHELHDRLAVETSLRESQTQELDGMRLQLASQTTALDGIDKQVAALLAVNERLQAELTKRPAVNDLMISQIAQAALAQPTTFIKPYHVAEFMKTVKRILNGDVPSSILSANEHAEVIADLGKTVDLTGTIFKTA